MIPYAVMAYSATKHSATGFTPNFMMFGREVSEPVDLVAHLPPDPVELPTSPEYVQQLRERLELAHHIVRDELGESLRRAKKQYDKSCCRTQYHVCDAVSYLVKGTRKVKSKVKKFLPSYKGPFFILGQLDDLVHRLQKDPKTKVKVVHHDRLKPYQSCDPLDNTWALEQAQCWSPLKVSSPTLDTDSEDQDLGLTGLFINPGVDDKSSSVLLGCASSAAASFPFRPPHVDSSLPKDVQASWGGVTNMSHQNCPSQRP